MGGSGGTPPGRARPRGNIEELASGSLRVRVFAGVDVLTGRDLRLRETIPAGPGARRRADEALERLLAQVMDGRQPKTNASLSLLIARHLEVALVQQRTREVLVRMARKHIEPRIGAQPIGAVDAQLLEAFYARLRRCRDHCDLQRRDNGATVGSDGDDNGDRPGDGLVHRAVGKHRCDRRCRDHRCRPLAAWTIRKVHFLISAAYESAMTWNWISHNPAARARKPAPPGPDPQPPTAEEAAALLNESWRRGFGPFVWLALTTGARRGELCALRWRNLQVRHTVLTEHDCAEQRCRYTLVIRRAIGQGMNVDDLWESDTKSHQRRHVALDTETVAVLADLRRQREREAAAVGATVTGEHFLFPATPDGDSPIKPSTMSERYKRCGKTLGIRSPLKNLRHYSATELITAGVDVRTVAGRLGHGGGGVTTLRVYAAWVSAADQHASTVLMSRTPARPTAVSEADRARLDPQWPHEQIAAQLERAWRAGELTAGESLTAKAISAAHEVSIGTAHRVMTLLSEWGVLRLGRGRPSVVTAVPEAEVDQGSVTALQPSAPGAAGEAAPPANGVGEATRSPSPATADREAGEQPAVASGRVAVALELLRLGVPVRTMRARLDLTDMDAAERYLLDAVRRLGVDPAHIGDYELAVRLDGDDEPRAIVVAAA